MCSCSCSCSCLYVCAVDVCGCGCVDLCGLAHGGLPGARVRSTRAQLVCLPTYLGPCVADACPLTAPHLSFVVLCCIAVVVQGVRHRGVTLSPGSFASGDVITVRLSWPDKSLVFTKSGQAPMVVRMSDEMLSKRWFPCAASTFAGVMQWSPPVLCSARKCCSLLCCSRSVLLSLCAVLCCK